MSKPVETVKEQYREMEVKVVEKKSLAVEDKTVLGVVTELVQTFINIIKAIFDFIKGLVW